MDKKTKIEKILKKQTEFTIQNNTYCFLKGNCLPKNSAGGGPLGALQNLLKKNGRLYYGLLNLLVCVLTSAKYKQCLDTCFKRFDTTNVIVNLGSGPQNLKGRNDVINVDIFAFDRVDITADATNLPIEDNCVDLVINIAMLEHVVEPHKVIQEINRILKIDGEVFAYVPFIQPYHAAPHDYYRWNQNGLKQLFSQFEIIDIFVGAGPTSGMLYIFIEWLSILLSFGNKSLHDIWFIIFMLLLFPVKYLDLILNRYSTAQNAASGFCVHAKRRA